MVRQDKITYLVTFFKSAVDAIIDDLSLNVWLADFSSSKHISQLRTDRDIFPTNKVNSRVLTRLGVINTYDIVESEALLSSYIPISRHKLLFVNIQKMGMEICTAFLPACTECKLKSICDYYNEKNSWSE